MTQKTNAIAPDKKKISTMRLILTVTFRILGVRNNQIKEAELGQLTGMQVGYACVFALMLFTAIIGGLSYFVAKLMS